MYPIFYVGLALIVVGLLIRWLAKSEANIVGRIASVTGIVLAAIGLVFLFTPLLIWVNAQLIAILGLRQ